MSDTDSINAVIQRDPACAAFDRGPSPSLYSSLANLCPRLLVASRRVVH